MIDAFAARDVDQRGSTPRCRTDRAVHQPTDVRGDLLISVVAFAPVGAPGNRNGRGRRR
jgi:hypothetical protein